MQKTSLNKMDLDVFSKTLSNGLKVYIIPKKEVNNIYVTFTTKYGSNIVEFVPNGEKDYIKVPLGIAHFLEHKMFEQEDEIDVFNFFSERGSDANANTNNKKTTYLFSGPNFFKENLEFLLDYVQKPYFTDENVEKEKGIIIQEMKMYQDDPYSKLYEAILDASFINNNTKYPIIGTEDSVNSITKEDLYACYKTFYHPSNMVLVVTGNVNPEETIEIIESNQSKKEFKKPEKIKIKEYNESDNVDAKKKIITANVTLPKVSINYKININNIKNITLRKKLLYLSILFDSKFGGTSLINEKLRESKIISDSIDVSSVDADSHILFIIMGETNKEKDFLDAIKKEMLDLTISEQELERKKKTIISSMIYASDSIMRINHKIMNDYLKYGDIIDNNYDEVKSLNYEEFSKFIKELDVSNYNIVVEDK